ncbi:MAG: hypothetical protein V1494_03405 [Candidatus Diapherotrites archaeon]
MMQMAKKKMNTCYECAYGMPEKEGDIAKPGLVELWCSKKEEYIIGQLSCEEGKWE